MRKSLSCLLILLFAAFCFICTGCKNNTSKNQQYMIYYMNSSANKLVEKSYITDTKDTLTLMRELVSQMNTRQKQEDCTVIKPERVKIEHITFDASNGIANIYFGREYNECEDSIRLLLNAGMVKMLTQVNGVSYVQFYVGGTEAEYPDGTLMGLLSIEDFVDDSNEAMDNIEWKNINLYYADKLGDKLVQTTAAIAYSKNVSLEKMVVERLIKGPSDTSVYAVLPSDLKLLNVSVSNRVCYVNLSTAFLAEMVNVSNEIPVYAIVNSLCELDTVDSVKIMINGDSNKTFRESISLDNTFTYNEDIVSR